MDVTQEVIAAILRIAQEAVDLCMHSLKEAMVDIGVRHWDFIFVYPLVMTNIAMQNDPFIVDLSIENGDVP